MWQTLYLNVLCLGCCRPDGSVSPLQVLLVSSSRHPDQWIVPGGGMEPDEEPSVAAVREVYEEVSLQHNKHFSRFSGSGWCYTVGPLGSIMMSFSALP